MPTSSAPGTAALPDTAPPDGVLVASPRDTTLRAGYPCNNRCRFCDQGGLPQEWVPLAQLRASLAEADPRGFLWLAGGEVTLRPDLPALVSLARDSGFRNVGLLTNGRVLAAAGAARALRSAGLTAVEIALHAPGKAVHDYLTGVEGSFRQARAGLLAARQAGLDVRVSSVLTRSLVPSLPAHAEALGALGIRGVRFHAVRAVGTAANILPTLLPRFGLLAAPLQEALATLQAARVDVETFGVPLCALGNSRWAAGDRADATQRHRLGVEAEAAEDRVQGPPCEACVLRTSCRGPSVAYVERYGWDDLVSVPGERAANVVPGAGKSITTTDDAVQFLTEEPAVQPPPPRAGRPPATQPIQLRTTRGTDPVPGSPAVLREPVFFPLVVPCTLACSPCHTREAFGSHWPSETSRRLRQRLVRLASEGVRGVVFAGASPWDHPFLPDLVREAARLGFGTIEVWGPIHPLAELDEARMDRLESLTRVLWSPIPDAVSRVAGSLEKMAIGVARLRARFPALPVEKGVTNSDIPGPLYGGWGGGGTWAGCQPTPAGVDAEETA